jgi:hypothetical protein
MGIANPAEIHSLGAYFDLKSKLGDSRDLCLDIVGELTYFGLNIKDTRPNTYHLESSNSKEPPLFSQDDIDKKFEAIVQRIKNGNSTAEFVNMFNTDETLRHLRLDSSNWIHSGNFHTTSRRYVLCCSKCASPPETPHKMHSRSLRTSCKICGVALFIIGRKEFNKKSCWDIWHHSPYLVKAHGSKEQDKINMLQEVPDSTKEKNEALFKARKRNPKRNNSTGRQKRLNSEFKRLNPEFTRLTLNNV